MAQLRARRRKARFGSPPAARQSPEPPRELVRRDLEATERHLRMHSDVNQWPSFAAMSGVIDDRARPPLDRKGVDESWLSQQQIEETGLKSDSSYPFGGSRG